MRVDNALCHNAKPIYRDVSRYLIVYLLIPSSLVHMHSLPCSPISRLREITTPCREAAFVCFVLFSPVPRHHTGALAVHMCLILPCKEELSPSKRLITSAETKNAYKTITWNMAARLPRYACKQTKRCVHSNSLCEGTTHEFFCLTITNRAGTYENNASCLFFFFPLTVYGDYSSATSSYSAT